MPDQHIQAVHNLSTDDHSKNHATFRSSRDTDARNGTHPGKFPDDERRFRLLGIREPSLDVKIVRVDIFDIIFYANRI